MWNLILLILFIGINGVILFNAFHKENIETRLYMISVSILIVLSVIIIYQEMPSRQNFTNSHSLITSYNKAANQIFTVLDDLNLEWWPTEGTLIGCLRWGSNFGMTENGMLVTDTDIDLMVRVKDDQNWQVVKKEIEKRLKTLDPEWIKFESHNHDIGISREPKFSCYYNKRWGLKCYGNEDIHVDIHSYMVDEKNNRIFMDPVCNGNNKCANKYPFQKWGGFAPYRGLIVDDKGLFKKCKFGNMILNCPYQSRKLLSNWNDNEYGTGGDLHLPRGNCVLKNSCWKNGDNILSSTDKLRLKNIAKELYDQEFESFYSYYVWKALGPRHFKFVEIGTSDFDTEIEKANDTDVGLSVEPLKMFLDRLPDKQNCTKVNVAISDRPDTLSMYYVDPEDVRKHELPSWVIGCNSLGKPQPTVSKLLQDKNLESLIKTKPVQVITFGMLMEEQGVAGIDYLKVDTEGHDPIVLRSMIEYCDRNPGVYPLRIQFESNGLADKRSEEEMIKALEKRGYSIESRGSDTIMTRIRNNIIYCFWTGTNQMSKQRQECLKQLREISQCNVILVTPDTLNEYILDEHPLHPSFKYLSETHKADYLRAYFMRFHGGGYSDIKKTTGSWAESFENLKKSDKWIIGYNEIEGGVAYSPLANKWRELIGNGAYICKPNTPLVIEWYNDMMKLMDDKYVELKKNPATFPQDKKELNNGYPIEWNEMLGRIFHKVLYKYKNKSMNTLPISIFHSYR